MIRLQLATSSGSRLEAKVLRHLPRWTQEHEDYYYFPGDIVKLGFEGSNMWIEEIGGNDATFIDVTDEDVELL